MRIGKLDTHPAADAFPLLEGPEYMGLFDDIREHGQRDLVAVQKSSGLLLDGRNRAKACFELSTEPLIEEVDIDEADVVDFVISRNLHRRHLTPSQRAIVADRLATIAHGRHKRDGALTQGDAAKLLHVSERAVRNARELSESGRADLVDSVAAGGKTLSRAVREAKRDESARKLRGEAMAAPTGRYRVVSLDPPWRYAKNAAMADVDGRRGEVDYPDMSLEEIVALDVPQWLEDDAIVWLWFTNAHMIEAAKIIEAWGLDLKTILTWKKPRFGTGDWLRGQTEHAALCVRGSPTVVLTNQSTILEAPAREHSRKPTEFYDLVDKLCPGTKLELFAREAREGWVTHGVDVDKFPSTPTQRPLDMEAT